MFLFVLERFYSPIPLFSKGFWQAKRKKSPQKIEKMFKKTAFFKFKVFKSRFEIGGGGASTMAPIAFSNSYALTDFDHFCLW